MEVSLVEAYCIAVQGVSILLTIVFRMSFLKYLYIQFFFLYGPMSRVLTEQSIMSSWVTGQLVPIVILLLDQSEPHIVALSLPQLLYLQYLYLDDFEAELLRVGPKEFVRKLVLASMALLSISIFCASLKKFIINRNEFRGKRQRQETENKNRQELFLLSFSHEIRKFSASILENLQAVIKEEIRPHLKEHLKSARATGEMLFHYVNNIAEAGKIGVGEVEINPSTVQICETLKEFWGIFSSLIKKKGLNGALYLSSRVPEKIEVDPDRLSQIIFNLVSNAIKFTEVGSVDIIAEWLDDKTTVQDSCFEPIPFDDDGIYEKTYSTFKFSNQYSLFTTDREKTTPPRTNSGRENGILKITVIDTGIGMDADQVKSLFQKFPSFLSNDSRQLGTGLGLFTSNEICKNMRGEIRAYSRPKRGSAFVFCLPARIIRDQGGVFGDMTRLSSRNSISTNRIGCLIADDVDFYMSSMSNVLKKLDIDVAASAKNGLEAYEKYKYMCEHNSQPTIVIMDIEMPLCNGKLAAEKIREYELRKNLPKKCILFLVSENPSDSERKECMNPDGDIRANEVLQKPLVAEEIRRVIRRCLTS